MPMPSLIKAANSSSWNITVVSQKCWWLGVKSFPCTVSINNTCEIYTYWSMFIFVGRLFLCRQEHVVSTVHPYESSHADENSWDSCYSCIIWHGGTRPEPRGKVGIRAASKKQHPMFQLVRMLLSFCKNLFRLPPHSLVFINCWDFLSTVYKY